MNYPHSSPLPFSEHPQAQKLGLAETVLEQLRHLSAIAAQPQLAPSTGKKPGF